MKRLSFDKNEKSMLLNCGSFHHILAMFYTDIKETYGILLSPEQFDWGLNNRYTVYVFDNRELPKAI